MLTLRPARKRRKHSARQPLRVSLAIAGGGPIGAMYEPGALRALDDAIEGLDLTRLDCCVGVSAGGPPLPPATEATARLRRALDQRRSPRRRARSTPGVV